MSSSWLFIILFVTLTLTFCHCQRGSRLDKQWGNSILEVTQEEGGKTAYSRVTVRISDDVPNHNCQQTLNKIKRLITSVSYRLFKATQERGYFADVIIFLPYTWYKNGCTSEYELETLSLASKSADFTIQSAHPAFGERPWTLQYGGCGVSGLGVRIPYSLVFNSNISDEKAEAITFLAWIRNRYGVFSENGYFDDTRYPDTAGSNGSIKNQNCKIFDFDQPNEYTKDVLLSFNSEIKMNNSWNHIPKLFCSGNEIEYLSMLSTKQNILCHGKSVGEILMNNSMDFVDLSNIPQRKHESFTPPNFRITALNSKENGTFESTYRRIIIVLDASQRMRSVWKRTREALFRFILHLPVNTEISIVTFGRKPRISLKLTKIEESERYGIHARIPYRLLPDVNGCVSCGIDLAVSLLKSSKHQRFNNKNLIGGSILLISLTNFEIDETFRQSYMQIKRDIISVYDISFGQINVNKLSFTESFNIFKYGQKYRLPSPHNTGSYTLLQGLSGIFTSLIGRELFQWSPKPHQYLATCYSRSFVWTGKTVKGNFSVEKQHLEGNIFISLTTDYMEDVESFFIIDPKGYIHEFPKYENGIVSFVIESKNLMLGKWTYKISLHPSVASESDINLSIEAWGHAFAYQELTTLDAWSSVSKSQDLPLVVTIFARLQKGNIGITNASVNAFIIKPGSTEEVKLMLRDDGTGYPDINSNDGIYSAYFTSLSNQAGFYVLRVMADDNAGHAKISIGSSNYTCCGSNFSVHSTINVEKFERHIFVESFYVDGISFDDKWPPSRISDLTTDGYTKIAKSFYVTLTWSAPGGDLDYGKAFKYDIRSYLKAEVQGWDFKYSWQKGIPAYSVTGTFNLPQDYGKKEKIKILVPWTNKVFYYGVIALDELGNHGLVSNLVEVYVEETVRVTNVSMTFNVVNCSTKKNNLMGSSSFSSSVTLNNNTMVYVITVSICAFVIILIVIFFTALVKSKQHPLTMSKSSQPRRAQVYVDSIHHISQKENPCLFSVAMSNNKNMESNVNVFGTELKKDQWKVDMSKRKGLKITDKGNIVSTGPASWSFSSSIHTASTQYGNVSDKKYVYQKPSNNTLIFSHDEIQCEGEETSSTECGNSSINEENHSSNDAINVYNLQLNGVYDRTEGNHQFLVMSQSQKFNQFADNQTMSLPPYTSTVESGTFTSVPIDKETIKRKRLESLV